MSVPLDLDMVHARRNRMIAIRAEQRAIRERGGALKEEIQSLSRKDSALDEELRKVQEEQYHDLCGWYPDDAKMQLPEAPWPLRWR